MEELLNKLIEKGWKPFGDMDIAEFNQIENTFVAINYESKVIGQPKLRQIVSKESDLWQFVCENKLWKDIDEEKYWHKKTPKMSELRSYDYHFEEYRLLESSLKEESELDKFLLDNIKV